MNSLLKKLTPLFLFFIATTAMATPQLFVTHNDTDVEANAYLGGGKFPSPYPTKAHHYTWIGWNLVRTGCAGHTTNGKCKAMIKMATDTDTPIELGMITLDLVSGDVSPKSMSANGYTLTVTGEAEIALTKN